MRQLKYFLIKLSHVINNVVLVNDPVLQKQLTLVNNKDYSTQ